MWSLGFYTKRARFRRNNLLFDEAILASSVSLIANCHLSSLAKGHSSLLWREKCRLDYEVGCSLKLVLAPEAFMPRSGSKRFQAARDGAYNC